MNNRMQACAAYGWMNRIKIYNPGWGCIYIFLFTFFLLDQKETKNQGHKNSARSARPINERYPRFKNRGSFLAKISISGCGFSNLLPASVRKPL